MNPEEAASGRSGSGRAGAGRRVRTVAVTGGIGAGKSTVSRSLALLGAIVVDSDQLAREVVAPGTEGLAAVIAAFGPEILATDGSLDRAALAAIIFPDTAAAATARQRLEAIIHPRVRAEFRRICDDAPAASIVVNDIPILRSAAQAAEFDLVVVVTAPQAARISRLVDRGLTEADARARIAAQISDQERVALANIVIDNDGDEAALQAQVEALWANLLAR